MDFNLVPASQCAFSFKYFSVSGHKQEMEEYAPLKDVFNVFQKQQQEAEDKRLAAQKEEQKAQEEALAAQLKACVVPILRCADPFLKPDCFYYRVQERQKKLQEERDRIMKEQEDARRTEEEKAQRATHQRVRMEI